MFQNAIVRKPPESMIHGVSSADLGAPDYNLACLQHSDYIAALRECGLKVTVLDALEEYPDGCFVEDVALFTPACAILTNPGVASRRGEVAHIAKHVGHFCDVIEKIEKPGTLEAGDVMMVGDHYYIGLSERTNKIGAYQLISILEKYGLHSSMISLSEVLHLKTGLSYLEKNNLLACGEFIAKPEFEKYNIVEINQLDAYSANSVWINGTVLVPAGFADTVSAVEGEGYAVREVAMSEFEKLDGGLSCLSLRF